jgi:long-chain acyl-CoA synthetase
MKKNFFSYVPESNLKSFGVFQNDKKFTFQDIEKLSDLLSKKIIVNETGVIGIIVSNTLESAMTYFAIKKIGLVPVIIPIDDITNGIDYLSKIGCTKFLCSKIELDTLNIEVKNFFKVVNISKNIDLFVVNDIEHHANIKMDGDIILTSGTSGKKKGVFISNQSIISSIDYISSIMKINSSYKEFLGVPFFHSFGLARLRMAIFYGSNIYMPKKNTDLAEALQLIKHHKPSIASFVPSSIEMFHKFFSKKIQNSLSSLKKIELGSSKLNHESLEWISNIANNATIYHHYGMTEASRTAFRIFNFREKFILGSKENYVSRPDAQLDLRNNHNEEMVGELSIKGDYTFSGYIKNIGDFKDLTTNKLCKSDDLVEMHSNTEFSIHGKSNLIAKKGGKKISLMELENNIEKTKGVEKSICYVSGESIRGDFISCLVELENDSYNSSLIDTILKDLTIKNFSTPDKIDVVEKIPLTFNGKKKRGSFV